MPIPSRWNQIVEGMTLDEVKQIFGEDIWQFPAMGEQTWMVNNETDPSPDHGYIITFSKNGKVKSKGSFSTAG